MDRLAIVAAIAWGIAFATTGGLVWLLSRWRLLDQPNERSSHTVPIPRGGGVGILIGLAVVAAWAANAGWPLPVRWATLCAATAVIAAVGLWDDLAPAGVPWWLRLIVQSLAALWMAAPVGGLERLPLPAPLDIPLGPLAVPVAVIWIVAVVNFVNFMDGIDGIAGAQLSAIGLALAGALAATTAGGGGAWLGLAVTGACLGFLTHNWQPACIFMGDVGSSSIGFLVAALPFAGWLERRSGVMLVGVSAFLFLADASLSVVRRLLRRERIWTAHRSHLYQRLVLAGYSHATVSGAVAAAALLLSALAVAAYRRGSPRLWWLSFGAGGLLFLLELAWTRRAERIAGAARSGD